MTDLCFCGKPLGHKGFHKGHIVTERNKENIRRALIGRPPWNKGLTVENDERVKPAWNKGLRGEEYLNHYEFGRIIGRMKGKRHIPETINKISESCESWWREHPEARQNQSERMRGDKNPNKDGGMGEDNPNWKGGNRHSTYPREFSKIRKEVLEEHEYICQFCSNPANTVHHIDYNKENCEKSNLVALCERCNGKANKNRALWKNFFSNIKKDFVLGRIITKENMDMDTLGEEHRAKSNNLGVD